jgi:ribosome-associated protein
MQYIGKLMRKVDAEPIRARLEAWKSPEREQVARFKRIEAWRERLVLEAHALEEFRRQYPAVDEGELAALIDEARRERQENRPPKAYRRLFQKLRELT